MTLQCITKQSSNVSPDISSFPPLNFSHGSHSTDDWRQTDVEIFLVVQYEKQ